MFNWGHIPLVRVVAIFASGILLGIYQYDAFSLSTSLAIASCFFLFYIVSVFIKSKSRVTKISKGIFGFCSLFFFGYVLVQVRTASANPSNISHIHQPIKAYRAVVEGHIEEKKNSFKTTLVVKEIKTDSGWREASGKINFYISRKTFTHNLTWGDEIIVVGQPQPIQPPANPYEFDFKRFLTFKNTYHQQFIQGNDYKLTGRVEVGLLRYSSLARAYFSSIIKKYVQGAQEQAVSLALVIGVTDGIDDELVSAYSASGAMHVLAVSGLHIGIIYWIILLLMKPLQKTKKGKWVVAVVSLIILWGYSFVTGLSPSVLRAVTMFSFMAIAKPLNIRSNIFNTLAASALILLLFDPYLIMSVGFQLSYLAVLGIIWIQRPLFLLYEAKTYLGLKIWEITCVSIAAQATTFSLGLLYFHQFPTYFLISNLIVIPVSFVVLIAGIVLIVVSAITPIAQFVGSVLYWSSWFLNKVVFIVEDWPVSIISNIYIDVFQAWIIMGIVASLIFVFQFKNMKWLYAAFALSVVLCTARWIHFNEHSFYKALYVFNVSGKSVIEIFDNNKTFLLSDSSLLNDEERIRFHIRPNRLVNLIHQTSAFNLNEGNDREFQVFSYSGKNFLFINHKVNKLPTNVKYDVVVIGTKAAWKTPEILANYGNLPIILDSSWSAGQISWLKKKLKALPENVYVVEERGTYIKKL